MRYSTPLAPGRGKAIAPFGRVGWRLPTTSKSQHRAGVGVRARQAAPRGCDLLCFSILEESVTFCDQKIKVAQRKRGGPIIHRSQDRNLALITF
jgi:hypothetical protein